MKKCKLVFCLFIPVAFQASGQEASPTNLKRIRIRDLYVQAGTMAVRSPQTGLSDFRALAPKSTLLNQDFSTFSHAGGRGTMINSMFSAQAGLQFRNKQKTSYSKADLRMGISYFYGSTLTGSYFKRDRRTFDTLTSSNPGDKVYLDSVSTKMTGMDYSSEQIRFDCSLIFRSNPSARWSFFGGVGISAGLLLNPTTRIYSASVESMESHNSMGTMYTTSHESRPGHEQTETFRNKTAFSSSVFLPMGVDFRLGQQREFWKRMHVFYELRAGVNMTAIPELRLVSNGYIQNGLGLRMNWN